MRAHIPEASLLMPAPSPSPPPAERGTQIGHFRLLDSIGRGGAGYLFLAEDLDIPGRRVALKLMRQDGIGPDLATLKREASALASMNHPHILVVHEVGSSPHGVYLVTEYMAGGSLADRLRAGPLSVRAALPLARSAADALRAAHDGGLLHRDIKPANLLLADDGRVKVADFGLAVMLPGAGPQDHYEDQSTTTAPTVERRSLAGTACYIAPEVLEGKGPSPLSDQFAFGVTLHEAITGRRPHEGSDWIQSTLSGRAKLDGSLPSDVARIIRRCVGVEPSLRYPSMAAVVADLDAAIGRRSPERKRLLRLAVGAAIVLMLAAAGWWFAGWRRTRQARDLNEAGRRAVQGGNLEEARRVFLAAHGADPAYLPACANLGYLAAMEQNPRWAITILNECAATFPESSVVAYNLGAVMRLTGDLAAAESRLKAALEGADPDLRPLVLNELALVLVAAGRPPEAVALLEGAEALPFDTVQGAILGKTRGVVLLEAGRPAEAVAVLRRVLSGALPDEQRPVALAALGRALELTGDVAGAVEAFGEVLLRATTDEQSQQAARAGLLRLQGR